MVLVKVVVALGSGLTSVSLAITETKWLTSKESSKNSQTIQNCQKTLAITFSLGKEQGGGGDQETNHQNDNELGENDNEEEEDDFEFAVLSKPEPQFPPISADDIFYNGQIRPFDPLFNSKLLLDDQESLPKSETATNTQDTKKPNRLLLKKLFYEERETFSCSSLEADDVDSAEPGTYCVWTPKKEEGSLGGSRKSSSTGSNSTRWKFRDLLRRSNSYGKDTFVFLTPNNKKSTGGHQRFGSDDHDGKNKKKTKEKMKEVKGVGGLFQFQELVI